MPAALHLPSRLCETCSTEYKPVHSRQVCCSKKCLWRRKNKANWAKPSQREKQRAYHKSHRARYNAQQLAKYHADPAKYLAARQTYYQQTRLTAPGTILLRNASTRAKKKGLPFDLNIEWVNSRWTGRCEITGIPFVLGEKGHGPKFFCPTIDRIAAERGYTQDNSRIILHAVNALKGSGTDIDMLLVAEAIVRKYSTG